MAWTLSFHYCQINQLKKINQGQVSTMELRREDTAACLTSHHQPEVFKWGYDVTGPSLRLHRGVNFPGRRSSGVCGPLRGAGSPAPAAPPGSPAGNVVLLTAARTRTAPINHPALDSHLISILIRHRTSRPFASASYLLPRLHFRGLDL